MFAFYFFSRGAALVHLALMAAGYALALVARGPGENPLDGWIATVGTLARTGLFVSFVRDRLGGMIHRLARRRAPRPAHRPAQPARLPGRLRHRARARPAQRPAAQPHRRRPRPLQARERRPRPRRRRRRPARVADAIRGAKRGFDSAARVGGEEFALLAPDCDEHGAYMLAERIRAAVARGAVSAGAGRRADDQLRDLDLPAPRPVGRRAPPHGRPGALRRQAARPQPLGDLERRGAGHPRARAARRTASRTWSWRRC